MISSRISPYAAFAASIALMIYNLVLAVLIIIKLLPEVAPLTFDKIPIVIRTVVLLFILINVYCCFESMREVHQDGISKYLLIAVMVSMLLLPISMFTLYTI